MWPLFIEHSDTVSIALLAALFGASLIIARGLTRLQLAGIGGASSIGPAAKQHRRTNRKARPAITVPSVAAWMHRTRPMAILPAELGSDRHIRMVLSQVEDAIALSREAMRAQDNARAKLDAAELFLTRMVEEVRGSSARIAGTPVRTMHAPYLLTDAPMQHLAA